MGGVTLEQVRAWVEAYAASLVENKRHLTKLDSPIGDADHGINMDRGFRAVLERLKGSPPSDIGGLLKAVGMALVSKVGGASGPLYGTFFMQLGSAAGERQSLDPGEWASALRSGIEGVMARGRAEPGDKTMVDALLPALEALEKALGGGKSLAEAMQQAEVAAARGVEETIPMVARKGRASYLGERSAGHQDPGATSSHLLFEAATRIWTQ